MKQEMSFLAPECGAASSMSTSVFLSLTTARLTLAFFLRGTLGQLLRHQCGAERAGSVYKNSTGIRKWFSAIFTINKKEGEFDCYTSHWQNCNETQWQIRACVHQMHLFCFVFRTGSFYFLHKSYEVQC